MLVVILISNTLTLDKNKWWCYNTTYLCRRNGYIHFLLETIKKAIMHSKNDYLWKTYAYGIAYVLFKLNYDFSAYLWLWLVSGNILYFTQTWNILLEYFRTFSLCVYFFTQWVATSFTLGMQIHSMFADTLCQKWKEDNSFMDYLVQEYFKKRLKRWRKKYLSQWKIVFMIYCMNRLHVFIWTIVSYYMMNMETKNIL